MKKGFPKKSHKSKSDVNVSENKSDFRFAKKNWDSDNIQIRIRTLTYPYKKVLLYSCMYLWPFLENLLVSNLAVTFSKIVVKDPTMPETCFCTTLWIVGTFLTNRSSWCHCYPITSCFIKIQIGITFLVLAYAGCPGKEAVKQVCLCWYSNAARNSE